MRTKDFTIYESGDGGQLSLINNDLQLCEVGYNQFYLALFGGNLEANTQGNEIESQLRVDYWQNSLFYPDNFNKQLNSNTERVLSNITLNDSGVLELERAINSDLEYLSIIFNYSVSTVINSTNQLTVIINFSEKESLEEKVLQMVINNMKNEIIIQRVL